MKHPIIRFILLSPQKRLTEESILVISSALRFCRQASSTSRSWSCCYFMTREFVPPEPEFLQYIFRCCYAPIHHQLSFPLRVLLTCFEPLGSLSSPFYLPNPTHHLGFNVAETDPETMSTVSVLCTSDGFPTPPCSLPTNANSYFYVCCPLISYV